jgi:hypothetical protein
MEHETRGGIVDPLQVVEDQNERSLRGHRDENGGDLLEDATLLRHRGCIGKRRARRAE